jgi:hypothetical protein
VRWRSVLIATVLSAVVFGGHARRRNDLVTSDGDFDRDEERADIDDTFALEVAERYNERIVANVDAIDTALSTILAGDVAVLVFTIDKIKELARGPEAWATALMLVSILACVVAYALGFSGRASKRDGIRPRMFIVDLATGPDAALRTAVVDTVAAGEQNLTLRFLKKALAVVAIVFLLAAAVVVAFARAKGSMVY